MEWAKKLNVPDHNSSHHQKIQISKMPNKFLNGIILIAVLPCRNHWKSLVGTNIFTMVFHIDFHYFFKNMVKYT